MPKKEGVQSNEVKGRQPLPEERTLWFVPKEEMEAIFKRYGGLCLGGALTEILELDEKRYQKYKNGWNDYGKGVNLEHLEQSELSLEE